MNYFERESYYCSVCRVNPCSCSYIVVQNEFHNTEAKIRLNENGHVNAEGVDKAAQKLCGMEDCTCHPVPLNAGKIVDVQGKSYEID